MSFEYRFRRSNYDETIFGYTADTRNAAGFTLDYAFRNWRASSDTSTWKRGSCGNAPFSDGWMGVETG